MKYPDLKEKTVLITGATRGIGRVIAQSLARQGAHVVVNYRPGREEVANDLKDELQALGAHKVSALCFDVSEPSQIKNSVDSFLKENGPITGLVNNAGISKDQLFFRLKEEDLDKTLDINLKGAIMVTSALSRSFLKGQAVSVVNVSSVVGLMGNPSQVAYSTAKAGLIGFTKSFAKEVASRNIRCNAICPGFIETEMTKALSDEAKNAYLQSIPLKRMGSSEEVAKLVSFLLSVESSYITGEIIKIDGGLYI
jgi:3-oxoacyl-[acyl-carrier protein] reductase